MAVGGILSTRNVCLLLLGMQATQDLCQYRRLRVQADPLLNRFNVCPRAIEACSLFLSSIAHGRDGSHE
jgi:hypothetical protein